MDFIRRVIDFIKTIFGLLIIIFVAAVYGINWWQEHKEKQQVALQKETIEAAKSVAKDKGPIDEQALISANRAYCESLVTLRELSKGDKGSLCDSASKMLLNATQQRGLTLDDYAELAVKLCLQQEDIDDDGENNSEYCEEERDRSRWTLMLDAVALALCSHDKGWIEGSEWGPLKKRGRDVYREFSLAVDCSKQALVNPDYEDFFANPVIEEYELAAWEEQLQNALYERDTTTIQKILSGHIFNQDAVADKHLMGMLAEDDRNIDYLRKAIEQTKSVNFDIEYYQQPLMSALEANSPKSVLMLINAGADPLRPGSDGEMPIDNAAAHGMYDAVKLLLARGADADGLKGSETANFGNPLQLAALHGHAEVVNLLLEHGARIKPDHPELYRDWEPGNLLTYAAIGGNFDIVKTLVDSGAIISPDRKLLNGTIGGSNPNVLVYLFEKGMKMPEKKEHEEIYWKLCDVMKREGHENTERAIKLLDLLLEKGLDLSGPTRYGSSLGHSVIHSQSGNNIFDNEKPELVTRHADQDRYSMKVLAATLKPGSDINQQDSEGRTMLMIAAERSKSAFVEYLLSKGADPAIKNKAGKTAVETATSEGKRLIGFWNKNQYLKQEYVKTIKALGGDPAVLEAK